jgi:hypothetical protein
VVAKILSQTLAEVVLGRPIWWPIVVRQVKMCHPLPKARRITARPVSKTSAPPKFCHRPSDIGGNTIPTARTAETALSHTASHRIHDSSARVSFFFFLTPAFESARAWNFRVARGGRPAR